MSIFITAAVGGIFYSLFGKRTPTDVVNNLYLRIKSATWSKKKLNRLCCGLRLVSSYNNDDVPGSTWPLTLLRVIGLSFWGSPLLLLTLPRSDHHIEGLHPSRGSFIQAHALISLNSSRTKEARVNSIAYKMFTLKWCSLIPGVDFPLLRKHLFGARDELQYM